MVALSIQPSCHTYTRAISNLHRSADPRPTSNCPPRRPNEASVGANDASRSSIRQRRDEFASWSLRLIRNAHSAPPWRRYGRPAQRRARRRLRLVHGDAQVIAAAAPRVGPRISQMVSGSPECLLENRRVARRAERTVRASAVVSRLSLFRGVVYIRRKV